MLNQMQAIGHLGSDPEMRATQTGDSVATFSVAVSERWRDKKTGEQKEKTEWIRCVAFGKLAEICGNYLKKGSKVYVSGKLTTRKWQGDDGQDRYTTEIVLRDMVMLDSKGDSTQAVPQRAPAQQARAAPAPPTFEEDSIPF